ncbi:unnamed protein product [Allacma fusca]|uniref:Uncharacterized protein n=1 Tax=Allacma fusca TaxID=39272 RepID=A0A8J2P666_9HEXA|nr:unnamed protein product [Allacma fusca]
MELYVSIWAFTNCHGLRREHEHVGNVRLLNLIIFSALLPWASKIFPTGEVKFKQTDGTRQYSQFRPQSPSCQILHTETPFGFLDSSEVRRSSRGEIPQEMCNNGEL